MNSSNSKSQHGPRNTKKKQRRSPNPVDNNQHDRTRSIRDDRSRLDTTSAILHLNGASYQVVGLPSEAMIRLALEGLKHLLTKSKNPKEKWERIQANQFGRKSKAKPPMMVRVLSRLTNTPYKEAAEQYYSLTDDEKRAFRRDPNVRAMRYRILAEDVTMTGNSQPT